MSFRELPDIQKSRVVYNPLFDANDSSVAYGPEAMGSGYPANSTAVGYKAMELAQSDARDNTAVGHVAMLALSTGDRNTSVGSLTLFSATTGSDNTAVGRGALADTTEGEKNTAVGSDALNSISPTSSECTAVGYAAGTSSTGDDNVSIGSLAGRFVYGSGNTAVGTSAHANGGSGSNNTLIGFNAAASTDSVSNQITLGNSSITSLRCQVQSISALSDERDKTNVKDSPYGLDMINQLRPVTFEWNMRDGGRVGDKDLGFIAQELVEVEDALEAHDVLALTLRDNPEKLEAAYGRLVPVLVKAIQELSAKVAALESR